MAPAQVWVKRTSSSCGKGLDEQPGQLHEGRSTLLAGRSHPVGEVVDGVVTTEQDPVVGAEPVVEELVPAPTDPLSA